MTQGSTALPQFVRRPPGSALAGWVVAAAWATCGVGAALAAPAERFGVTSEFTLPRQVWAGEVFPLTHRLAIPQRYFYSLASGINWSPAGLILEGWSPPEKTATGTGDSAVFEFVTRNRAVAATAGTLPLEPIAQTVTLKTGISHFGNYSRPNLEESSAVSAALQLLVRPLPAPPPEAGIFTGAVGHFTLRSQAVPDHPTVGKTVTWTVTFSGTGNWPQIKQLPLRAAPAHFKVLKSLRTAQLNGRSRFEGTVTEDMILEAEEPGRVTVGPLRWSYFDPQLERYLTLTTEAAVLTVDPAATVPHPVASTAWQAPAASGAQNGTVEAPRLPPPSLRDPVASLGQATVPAKNAVIGAETLLILAALLPAWLILAWRRMRRRDPLQPRREARQRALRLLDELARTSESARTRWLVENWQREIAAFWALRQAAPLPAAFAPSAEWRQLWREANAARFSPSTPLPPDWVDRARTATLGRRLPPLRPWSVLQPRHLLPLACLVLAGGAAAQAVPADTLYRAGDFLSAEAAWRAAVQEHPLDSAAHHNLALALAQQGKIAEAAAHTAVAFAQCPTDPVVRWDLGVTWRKARFGTPEIVAFLNQSPVALWAQGASIARWQEGIVAGAILAAAGLIGLLWAGFDDEAPVPARWGWIILGIGLAVGGSSALALGQFGDLARPDAALVWREAPLRPVPTEVGGTQEAPLLSPGTLVRVDDAFLTWRHLTLSNGQTGWLRNDLLVPIWK